MKLLLINLVFCLGLATPLQAQDTLQDSLVVLIPTQFYKNADIPLFVWKEEPTSFQFMLYDRWGNLIASTNKDPHFVLNDLMDKSKTKLSDNSTYFIILEFTLSDGTKRKLTSSSSCLGFYCSG